MTGYLTLLDTTKETVILNAQIEVPLEAAHFGRSPEERRLLHLIMRDSYKSVLKPCMYTYVERENPNFNLMCAVASETGFQKTIMIHELSCIWNKYLSRAISEKQDFLGPFLNVTIPIKDIRFKEPNHFRKFITKCAKQYNQENLPNKIREFRSVNTADFCTLPITVRASEEENCGEDLVSETRASTKRVREEGKSEEETQTKRRCVGCDRSSHRFWKKCDIYQWRLKVVPFIVRRSGETKAQAVDSLWHDVTMKRDDGESISEATLRLLDELISRRRLQPKCKIDLVF